MADINRLETIIQLRYGTYSQWMNSDVILKTGEAAICAFPQNRTLEDMSNSKPEHTPPAIGIKIGDGSHYFRELPWVQAVAADVYNWAKSSAKPSYTAQEIQGLQAYVESLIGGDVDVNIAPRIYQLVRGTGDNINKYYLRYKENDENSNWIIDTSASIDLQGLEDALDWLGRNNIADYPNLISRTAEQIRYFIGLINATDTAREHYFVTEVSQSGGTISVERAQPAFSDISGTAAVDQGGTGHKTLTEDYVLVGNGTDPVKLIPIAESIANNNHLVPNNLIKAYVDTAVAGITGAMHFIGDASVVINNNSSVDPRISDYVFANAQPGDVILYDSKEFVWTGANWRLLGDEGSYAVKGSIKDADIDAEAAIQQSKIAGLEDTFDTKVDKVSGKTLTSNDFTDEDKEKLDLIDDGAQVNKIEHILVNGIEVAPTIIDDVPKSVNIEFIPFTETEKDKLSEIEAEAQVNKIESITINGTEYVPDNSKNVDITIDQAALDLDVLTGARVPGTTNGSYEDVDVTSVTKQLELARVAKTGYISDLVEKTDTYITLYCGNSREVI